MEGLKKRAGGGTGLKCVKRPRRLFVIGEGVGDDWSWVW